MTSVFKMWYLWLKKTSEPALTAISFDDNHSRNEKTIQFPHHITTSKDETRWKMNCCCEMCLSYQPDLHAMRGFFLLCKRLQCEWQTPTMTPSVVHIQFVDSMMYQHNDLKCPLLVVFGIMNLYVVFLRVNCTKSDMFAWRI